MPATTDALPPAETIELARYTTAPEDEAAFPGLFAACAAFMREVVAMEHGTLAASD